MSFKIEQDFDLILPLQPEEIMNLFLERKRESMRRIQDQTDLQNNS